MFRKIIRQFVILLFLSCCVMSTAQPSADELSAMMAEDVRIAQELINEMPAEERLARVEKLSANYSRLCGEVFGSSITFGSLKQASAPGQIGADQLSSFLHLLHEGL